MGSNQNIGWILDYNFNLMDDVQAADFIWDPQIVSDETVASAGVGLDVSSKDGQVSSKKRARVESSAIPGTKACREKQRRDRLNDRFLELCSVLYPGRPPKTDKIVILSDATRLLVQLRLEAEKLNETNETLQDAIKNLKAEKMELRDEKVRLKAEKERMDQMFKGMSVRSPFLPHPAAAAMYQAAAFAANKKTIPYPNHPPMVMWQWLPPAFLDTSQDHVLRPPVA